MDEEWDGHYNLHYMITWFNADAAFYNCPDIVITPPGTAPVTNIDVLGSALCSVGPLVPRASSQQQTERR